MSVEQNFHMSRPDLSTVAELLKPITWFPPMWAFSCGVVSSGMSLADNGLLIVWGVLLAGPLVCASSQAVNDWFDRHVDAINEPHRPIPSGRMPGLWGLYIAVLWTLLSLLWAWPLGLWGFAATGLGLFFSWAYSTPPIRLKNNGWWGNTACALSYEGLAWVTGAAVMLGGEMPSHNTLVLALLYSFGAHGIMTLNDFKAVAGDAQMGVRSLPVQLGVTKAAWTACVFMLLAQWLVAALLLDWGSPNGALAVLLLSFCQLPLMLRFVQNPVDKALSVSAFGVPLFVSGMMVSAWSLRELQELVP
ncbi:MAG: chlorophyll synthase ChlG [Betaproteobacteria bacterium]